MDVVLLLIIAASGLCAVSSRVDREYHLVEESKTWTEAQRYCREKYTDLATIDSMEDVKILSGITDLDKATWIGLYDDVDSWRWSLSDRSFYKEEETEFRRWKSGQPDSYKSEEHCTYMDLSGQWLDFFCGASFKPVCMYVTGPNVKFILIDQSMNWTEAQSLCRARYTDLASVRNMEDNQKVKELVPPGKAVWIGLFRDGWKWSDGSSSSFRNWRQNPKEPDNGHGTESCALKQAGFSAWLDAPCSYKRNFLCYRQRTTKQVLKLRLQKENPFLDLNDPAVAEGLLEQLRQKLKDQGLNEGIKLSWRKQPDGKVFHKKEEKTKKRSARKKRDEF